MPFKLHEYSVLYRFNNQSLQPTNNLCVVDLFSIQNISNSGTSIAPEDDLESLNSENAGFDLEHDEYELSSSEESEDESDNKGRISPESDCNDHNFDL